MRLTRVTLTLLALIIGFGFYHLVNYLLDDVDAQTFQATEEVMVDAAHVLAGMVESELKKNKLHKELLEKAFINANNHKISAKIYKYLKTSVGLDTYLTDHKGIVLFDSANPERIGKDFSIYNDVRRTLKGEYGARSSRMNEADSKSSYLYVAAPIYNQNEIIGVLTVYKAQSDVLTFITHRRNDIMFATVTIGGGIILLTGAVFIWLFQPVGKLTNYAHSISRGERLPMPKLGKGREVNTLGKALHDMRETLEGRRYVENYISSLTHELKSPLAAIKGSAELLREDMTMEQRQRFLENILKETHRSETLVSDLLQLAELERKPFLEHQRELDLAEVCMEACDVIQPRLTAKSLELEASLQPNIRIKGDAMILKLAIVNLLENAVSFSPAHTSISIHLASEEHQATISIKDQGPGLPDYAVAKAFEHFYSLPRPDSDYKGTGLGLPLVLEATKLHDGSASIRNLPEGTGCVAQIILPVLYLS